MLVAGLDDDEAGTGEVCGRAAALARLMRLVAESTLRTTDRWERVCIFGYLLSFLMNR